MIGEVNNWLSATATIVSLGAALYTWLTSRSKANSTKIEKFEIQLDKLEKEVDRQDVRIDRLVSDMQRMPDQQTVHKIELTMTQIQGSIETMAAGFSTMNHSVTRLEDYLYNKPGTDR